jgi:thioredoxin reductase (NADPH)
VFLAERTRRVHLFLRGGDLGKGMSRYLVDRVLKTANVDVHLCTEARELVGEGGLEGIVVEDNRSGERRTLDARALFVLIGAEASTGWLRGTVELDGQGFVLTGEELAPPVLDRDRWRRASRAPLPLETSLPGVFAAGDVRSGSIKRVASAVGEGSMAVQLVHRHLAQVGAPRRGVGRAR